VSCAGDVEQCRGMVLADTDTIVSTTADDDDDDDDDSDEVWVAEAAGVADSIRTRTPLGTSLATIRAVSTTEPTQLIISTGLFVCRLTILAWLTVLTIDNLHSPKHNR